MKLKVFILSALVAVNVFSAEIESKKEHRFITVLSTTQAVKANNFLKQVKKKLSNNKYYDLADISKKNKHTFVYIRTKAIDKVEAKSFIASVRKILGVKDAYYCPNKGCYFDVKNVVTPREVKDIKDIKVNNTINMTLDEIVEKLSQEK